MPRTNTEIDKEVGEINERLVKAEQETYSHHTRLEVLDKQVKDVYDDHRETARQHNDLRRETEKRIALLEHKVDELQKDRDKWANRFWLFVIPLSVAVLSAIVLAGIGLKK